MDNLTPAEQIRLSQLGMQARAANDYEPPLTPNENEEYKDLYNRNIKRTQNYGGRPSKKRPTARRLRSSKARKSHKARATRRR